MLAGLHTDIHRLNKDLAALAAVVLEDRFPDYEDRLKSIEALIREIDQAWVVEKRRTLVTEYRLDRLARTLLRLIRKGSD